MVVVTLMGGPLDGLRMTVDRRAKACTFPRVGPRGLVAYRYEQRAGEGAKLYYAGKGRV